MWIFRRRANPERRQLRASIAANNELRAVNAELRARCAAQQATIDWTQARVNSLEMERAALTERILGVVYPVPQIERTGEVPAGRAPDVHGRPIVDREVGQLIIPPHLREASSTTKLPAMAGPRVAAPVVVDDYAASLAAHLANPNLFEDPGDAEAARQGIGHDNAGNVAYKEG